MITKTDATLAKSLMDQGLVKAESLEPLIQEAAQAKESLSALLVKKGLVSEEDLLKSLAPIFKTEYKSLLDYKPEPKLIEKVPLKIADYYKIIPISLVNRNGTWNMGFTISLLIPNIDDSYILTAHQGSKRGNINLLKTVRHIP